MFLLEDFFGFAGDVINGTESYRDGDADDVFGGVPGLIESVETVFRGRCRRFERIRVFKK
jgi:hypothetical protein